MFTCEGFAIQTRVKYLRARLVHSVLRVKVRGGIFSPCLHPPRRCGEGYSAPPFLLCR